MLECHMPSLAFLRQQWRSFTYALQAQTILDGGESRDNLLPNVGGLTFRMVTTIQLNSWVVEVARSQLTTLHRSEHLDVVP